jgi:hypothetical protein
VQHFLIKNILKSLHLRKRSAKYHRHYCQEIYGTSIWRLLTVCQLQSDFSALEQSHCKTSTTLSPRNLRDKHFEISNRLLFQHSFTFQNRANAVLYINKSTLSSLRDNHLAIATSSSIQHKVCFVSTVRVLVGPPRVRAVRNAYTIVEAIMAYIIIV